MSETVVVDGVRYLKCGSCGNPMQIRETGLCAPCTFGEADSLDDYEPILEPAKPSEGD